MKGESHAGFQFLILRKTLIENNSERGIKK